MSKGPNYTVAKRRRREQKTDYQSRLKLLKSGETRIVVRTTNKHTRVHFTDLKQGSDESQYQTMSKQLEEYGWEHHTSNIPAAYLTGLLAGQKADVDKAVFDSGTRNLKPGSRRFAAVKGAIDAGVEIPVSEDSLPDENRLHGGHIEKMKETNISENFEQVKQNILE